MRKMKVLIIDPQFITRLGLIHLIMNSLTGVSIYEAEQLETAYDYLGSGEGYDFIFMEYNYTQGTTQQEAVSSIVEKAPDAHVVIFSWDKSANDVRQALKAGAKSYLDKSLGAEELKLAMHDLKQGKEYLPALETLNENKFRTASGRRLSPRQREIMLYLSQGMSNKEIAETLDITEGTIRVHLSAIFKAIKVSNRTEATLWYLTQLNK